MLVGFLLLDRGRPSNLDGANISLKLLLIIILIINIINKINNYLSRLKHTISCKTNETVLKTMFAPSNLVEKRLAHGTFIHVIWSNLEFRILKLPFNHL